MIENHIKDSKAVVPIPNPNFDPEQYHPERIGKPVPKKKKAAKKPTGKTKAKSGRK